MLYAGSGGVRSSIALVHLSLPGANARDGWVEQGGNVARNCLDIRTEQKFPFPTLRSPQLTEYTRIKFGLGGKIRSRFGRDWSSEKKRSPPKSSKLTQVLPKVYLEGACWWMVLRGPVAGAVVSSKQIMWSAKAARRGLVLFSYDHK